ncbi:hypothetical protein Syun_029578 [Stephania yunnanensis]|uniref:Uncharacterized protein n=1 Tax=Stephania yunnanensis TaxID=152371 RepID=A0AAP0E5U5_9MAGN
MPTQIPNPQQSIVSVSCSQLSFSLWSLSLTAFRLLLTALRSFSGHRSLIGHLRSPLSLFHCPLLSGHSVLSDRRFLALSLSYCFRRGRSSPNPKYLSSLRLWPQRGRWLCRRRLQKIGSSEALSRRRPTPHPKPSPNSSRFLSSLFTAIGALVAIKQQAFTGFRAANISSVKEVVELYGSEKSRESKCNVLCLDRVILLLLLWRDKATNRVVPVLVYWRIKYNGTFPEDDVVIVSIVILVGLFSIKVLAKHQRRRQELTQTTPNQSLEDEAMYYKVAGECPKGSVYNLRTLWRKKRRYLIRAGSEAKLLDSVSNLVSDPLLIRDGLETEYINSVSDPLLIRDRSETEYNNSVSDPLLIRDGLETECIYSFSDPLLIRDGSETELMLFVSDPSLISNGS